MNIMKSMLGIEWQPVPVLHQGFMEKVFWS